MAQEPSKKRQRVSQSDVPRTTLSDALVVPRALREHFADDPTRPLQVASAADLSPQSSRWRDLTGAAIAYGLTKGGYNAPTIELTDLGLRAVAPQVEGDDRLALREAALQPIAFGKFLRKYDGKKFPRADIAKDVLEQECGVPRTALDRAFELLRETASVAGLLMDIKGSTYVELDVSPEPIRESDPDEGEQALEINPGGFDDTPHGTDGPPKRLGPGTPPERPVRLFIGHGTKVRPLEQLKKILDDFAIPYAVAEEEPHAGRPISEKVADLMRSCTGGVFVFSADDLYTDAEGNTVHLPRQNVIYELGAASLLYGRGIVIFKEESVSLPSNFSDLGYIEFTGDNLEASGMDLFRELLALGAVKIVSATSS